MFSDPFYQISSGEVFQLSNCMIHEHAVVNLLTSTLTMLGYSKINSNNRTWQKGNKTVVVCLTDDFGVCRQKWTDDPSEWSDSNTVIFTDSYVPDHVSKTLPYQLYRLPSSYYGIFSYRPGDQQLLEVAKKIHPDAKIFRPNKQFHFQSNRLDSQEFQTQTVGADIKNSKPNARFHFSTNRMDQERLHLVLEFIRQAGPLEKILTDDYINFNAWDPTNPGKTIQDILASVEKFWKQLPQLHNNTEYEQCIDQLKNLLPLRNHEFTIEQAHSASQLNLVIETYAGDVSIAFSEKIFRALVTPAPWTVFSAQNAVQYLKTLGFDVVDDLVDHLYDLNLHDNSKIKKYIESSRLSQEYLQTLDPVTIMNRYKHAAEHNQKILQQMQQIWPADFARWLPGAIEKIQ